MIFDAAVVGIVRLIHFVECHQVPAGGSPRRVSCRY